MPFRLIITALCLLLPALGHALEVRFEVPRYTLTESERETIAAVLILEAGGEGQAGMEGVMAVINNRAKDRPELYESVVWKRGQFAALASSQGNPRRFARMLAISREHPRWQQALSIVDAAARGELVDRTGGATHFLHHLERPYWLYSVRQTAMIGGHRFFAPRT